MRFLALDRLPRVPESNLPGTSLVDHLSFREPLEAWGSRVFQRFRMDAAGVWSRLQEAWPAASVIWVGPEGVRIDEVTVQTGSVQEGSLGCLARQQEIEQLEQQTSELSADITAEETQQEELREAWSQTQEALEQVQSEQQVQQHRFRQLEQQDRRLQPPDPPCRRHPRARASSGALHGHIHL